MFFFFFALQCTHTIYDGKLPTAVQYRGENTLTRVTFKNEDVLEIIRSLNVNKAHGHDDISIILLKICDAEVMKLSLLFKDCAQCGVFPNLCKK